MSTRWLLAQEEIGKAKMVERYKSEKKKESPDLGLPFILLCLYLIWDFVRPADIFPILKNLRISLLLTVVLVLPVLSKVLADKFFKDNLARSIAWMFVIAFISLVWVDNRGYWLTCIKGLSLILIVEFIGVSVLSDSTKKIRIVIDLLIFSHTFVAIYGIVNLGVGPGNFLSDENDLALALLCIFPLTFFMAQLKEISRIRRWVYIICAVIIFFGVVATNSRGGFLGFLAVIIVSFLFFPHKKKFIGVLIISALLIIPVISDDYIKELQTISDTSDSTADGRLWSWKLAFDMFKDSPIGGVGMCNYRWNVGEYELAGLGGKWGEMRPSLVGRVSHSIYFTILPELGLVGFLMFLVVVKRYYRKLRENLSILGGLSYPEKVIHSQLIRCFLASMAGYLVAGGFITAFYTYPQFWLLCGLAIAVTADARRCANIR